jgi:photosystem II stability/assembly factor-like uncharacterized protein
LVTHLFGWAVVDSRVNVTSDGGKTWRDITPDHGSDELFSNVFFSDNKTGYLTFLARQPDAPPSQTETNDDIVIDKTIDAGQTWERSVIRSTHIPRAFLCCASVKVFFLDSQHGWLISPLSSNLDSSIANLLFTIDGGKSWHALPSPPSAEIPVFVTPDFGWTTKSDHRTLLRTDDAGHIWKQVQVPPRNECITNCTATYDLPLFQDSLNGRIAVTFHQKGSQSYVTAYVTRDGGNTWMPSDKYVEGEHEIMNGNLMTTITPVGLMRVWYQETGTLDVAMKGEHKTAKMPMDAKKASVSLNGFIDNNEGWLTGSGATCDVKKNCGLGDTLFITTDGGNSYSAIPPQTICAACVPSPYAPPTATKTHHKWQW